MSSAQTQQQQQAPQPTRTPSPQPPDILTYRHAGTLVYVTPAPTYEEGVAYAQRVFPALAGLAPDRIALSLASKVSGAQGRKAVRIGPMAWAPVLASLMRYEIVDVAVDAPPEYSVAAHECTCTGECGAHAHGEKEKEKERYLGVGEEGKRGERKSKSRSPSPAPAQRKKSPSPSPGFAKRMGMGLGRTTR